MEQFPANNSASSQDVMAMRKLDHDAYTVGWVCALDCELNAARALLDEEDEALEPALHDENLYLLGRFEKHNVVITSTSGYGTNSATQAVTNMIRSFPNVRFGLMVGVGGAVPCEPNLAQPMQDVRLGDVVVSEPKGNHGGVLNYDMGKWKNSKEFSIESHLNSPPGILRHAVTQLRLDLRFRKGKISEYIDHAVNLLRGISEVDDAAFPGWEEDRLFEAEYEHVNPTHEDCRECDSTQIIERSARLSNTPVVHYGLIASGNAVMRSAKLRDRLRDAWNIKCFEMEAAGLMNHFPCLVIRGLCDYSDSHKAKRWQAYAAVAAAAYAKDLLRIIGPERIKNTEAATDNMKDVINAISQVDDGVQRLKETMDGNSKRKILDWLSPIDHESEQSDFFATRQERTGQWFLESEEFQRWLNEPNQTLLCQGIPGAGKSVMTSIVVHDLHRRFSQVDGIGMTYVYGNFLRRREQELPAILSSLLKQLCKSLPELPTCVTEAYKRFWTHCIHPSPEKLLEMLRTVIASRQKTYVIVDALDEIGTSDGTRRQLLTALFKLRDITSLHFLASSRHVADTTSVFRRNGSHFVEIRAHDDDIRCYVDAQLNKARSFVSENHELRLSIKETVVRAVDGMFLLAKLHLDSLADRVSKGDVRTALESLPTGSDAYDRVYDESLVRIQSQPNSSKDLARRALMWTVCTKNLLTVEGLQQALAITSTTKVLNAENMPEIGLVVEVCSGLIRFDEKSQVLRPVHFTAQEYLQRKWKMWFSCAHSEIAWVCVAYLSLGMPKPVKGVDVSNTGSQWSSLYDYASSNWQYHARLDSTADDIFARKLLEDPMILTHWNQTTSLRCFCEEPPKGCFVAPTNASALHFAVYYGTETSVKLLLEKGLDCDKRDDYRRTPLAWAAEQSNLAAARALLDAGANANRVDCIGCTPLIYAAGLGSPEMVRLLLRRGARIDNKCNAGGTPFSRALVRDQIEVRDKIIESLVSHDAALSAETIKPEELDDILEWAKSNEWNDFIRILGEKCPSEFKGAFLLEASRAGNFADVKRLLEQGANINHQGPWGRSSVICASEYGHLEIVKLLMENGADSRAKDHHGWTPLHAAAAFGGHLDVCEFLVENGLGAEINTGNKDWWTPLHEAAFHGHLHVCRFLLENHANVELKDNAGRSALHLAEAQHHVEVTNLLRRNGAAMIWAAENGHLETVKLLIGRGVDIRAKNGHGWMPLHAAACNGHLDVCEFLVENGLGAEINTGNKDWWTPLHEAAFRGHLHVCRFLLENHANVELKDNAGRSALHLAEAQHHVEVANLLREILVLAGLVSD